MLARYIFYLIVVLLTAAVLSDDGSSSEGGSTVTVEPENNKEKAKLRASHTNVNNIGSTSQADISSTMSTNSNSGKDIFVHKVKAKPIANAARSINKGEQDMSSQLKVPLEDVFSSPTTITKDDSNIPQQPSFVSKVAKRKARPKRKLRASSIAAARTNGEESSQQQPMSPLTDVPSNPTTNNNNNNNNNNGGGTVIASNSTVILTSNAFTTNNVIYANIPDINKQVMCRPSNKNKLASFILDHFNRARVLLQRPAVGTNFNDYVELMLLYKINQFYHFNKRVTIFHTAGKIPIGYAQVLKCASQNILQNIGTMYSKGFDRNDFKSQLDYDFFNIQLKSLMPSTHEASSKTFTFIRDPMEHFMAGFSEVIYRSWNNKAGGWIDADKVAKYIEALLEGNFNILFEMEHVYPMSGVFFEFDIHIVGYLESFDNDWKNVIGSYFHLNKPYNPKLGGHPTSQRPANRVGAKKGSTTNATAANTAPIGAVTNRLQGRNVLKSLFAAKKVYKMAVCHLILVDYVCFPNYKLPDECSYLQEEVEAARKMLQ